MTDMPDDPLFGLLTDIAQGVATLAGRIDAMEIKHAEQELQMAASLAIIAEIATRTYYASKPVSALPESVLNAPVMDPMIERWSPDWIMTFPTPEFTPLKEIATLQTTEVETLLRAFAVVAADATNAQRLRRTRALLMLNAEMDKRFKAHDKSVERDRS